MTRVILLEECSVNSCSERESKGGVRGSVSDGQLEVLELLELLEVEDIIIIYCCCYCCCSGVRISVRISVGMS